MILIGPFLHPGYSLIRAGQLTHTTELASIEMFEPTVGTAAGPVQYRNDDAFLIELRPYLKNTVWTDRCAEITPFTPAFIDYKLHLGTSCLYIERLHT
jgi:hypothetical protein